MRVLVTRPEPGGEKTARRLVAMGHEPVWLPLFEARITASPEELPPTDLISGLVATSARAFLMFARSKTPASSLRDVPVHAVGSATAAAAREAGFTDVREGGGTAQSLIQTLAGQPEQVSAGDESARSGGTLVYLAGVPRTPVIESGLESRGMRHEVLECYEMTEISYSTDILISEILSPPPDAVLLYSSNAARRFSVLTDVPECRRSLDFMRFVCLSAAIADDLPKRWQGRAVIAERPDEASLLASLAALG